MPGSASLEGDDGPFEPDALDLQLFFERICDQGSIPSMPDELLTLLRYEAPAPLAGSEILARALTYFADRCSWDTENADRIAALLEQCVIFPQFGESDHEVAVTCLRSTLAGNRCRRQLIEGFESQYRHVRGKHLFASLTKVSEPAVIRNFDTLFRVMTAGLRSLNPSEERAFVVNFLEKCITSFIDALPDEAPDHCKIVLQQLFEHVKPDPDETPLALFDMLKTLRPNLAPDIQVKLQRMTFISPQAWEAKHASAMTAIVMSRAYTDLIGLLPHLGLVESDRGLGFDPLVYKEPATPKPSNASSDVRGDDDRETDERVRLVAYSRLLNGLYQGGMIHDDRVSAPFVLADGDKLHAFCRGDPVEYIEAVVSGSLYPDKIEIIGEDAFGTVTAQPLLRHGDIFMKSFKTFDHSLFFLDHPPETFATYLDFGKKFRRYSEHGNFEDACRVFLELVGCPYPAQSQLQPSQYVQEWFAHWEDPPIFGESALRGEVEREAPSPSPGQETSQQARMRELEGMLEQLPLKQCSRFEHILAAITSPGVTHDCGETCKALLHIMQRVDDPELHYAGLLHSMPHSSDTLIRKHTVQFLIMQSSYAFIHAHGTEEEKTASLAAQTFRRLTNIPPYSILATDDPMDIIGKNDLNQVVRLYLRSLISPIDSDERQILMRFCELLGEESILIADVNRALGRQPHRNTARPA